LKPFTFNSKQFKTKNFKGVLSLLAGNTISKIIVTIGGIILANYYGPDSYGVYNVFLSYVLILPVMASLRLDNIMILQKGSKELRNLFSGIVFVSFIVTTLLILSIAILKFIGISDFQMPYSTLFLTGIASLLTAWNLSQNNLFTKYKFFKQISAAFVISSIVSVLFQGIFYLLGMKENGLIYGWILGLTASFLYNFNVSKSQFQRIDFSAFKQSIKEHQNIVKFTYPSDVLNAVANNLLPILALFYFTDKEVGLYTMAFKILSMPLILLSNSVSRVYFQKAVTLNNSKKIVLKNLTYKVILTNVFIIFSFVVFLNTIGLYLLNYLLNDSWEDLGLFIFILSFWLVARSALNPIFPILLVLNKNHYSLYLNIYLLIVNFIAIFVGVKTENFLDSIWVFSILSGIGYLIVTCMIISLINRNKENEA
jgi:lipopolysaccharide exporter